MNSRRLWLIACLALPCTNAWSGSETLARQFIELVRSGDQYRETQAQCLKSSQVLTPEKLLNITAENPGPVPPGSRLWPKVLAAYDTYWAEVCARPTREEYFDVIAKRYAKDLTDEDLRASIQFFSSPPGSRLIASNTTLATELSQEWQRLNAESLPLAVANLQATLARIAEEASRERCRERSKLTKSDCDAAKAS